MRYRNAGFLLSCALIALAACGQAQTQPRTESLPVPVAAQVRVAAVVEPAMDIATDSTAGVVLPVVLSTRETLQAVLPPPVAPGALVSPAAAALIVRWEVTSAAHYTRKLDRPIWPGGASGVTWGIGYDGGHNTRLDIARDWELHEAVARLADTSGLTGATARAALPGFRDIVTPFEFASDVFVQSSLPAYHATTRRVFRPAAFDALPLDAQGALVSVVYNRGGAMTGDRNREKRVIRDECLPGRDVTCIAAQIRSMCRLWRNTALEAGLCNRREDEARLSEAAR